MDWKKLREFDQRGLLICRVEGPMAYMRSGYVFDRRIFRAYGLLLILLIVVVIASSPSEWRGFYVHCPETTGACPNPFFMACHREECRSIEQLDFLPPGFVMGTPPSESYFRKVSLVQWSAFLGFLVAALLNHWRYNKGKLPFELEVVE